MSSCPKIIETFPSDSPFLVNDSRATRWAIPYNYEALNSRVENLLINHQFAIQDKKILDLACHFGTFSYAALFHGANYLEGIDSEDNLIFQANDFFKLAKIPKKKYRFITGDLLSYLENQEENSFDTIFCLGIFYYILDPFYLLQLLKKVTARYIILDTFTAYYSACVSKEGELISLSIKDNTFDLPLVIYPLTRAQKKDYNLQNYNLERKKVLTCMTLPTVLALERFFEILDFKFQLIAWDKYIINNFSWIDFKEDQSLKRRCHWADLYHTKIRVAYFLEI